MPELRAFVADVTARYPVNEIVLFGSRARGNARPDSDWDVIVCLDAGASPDALLADTTLQRHFGEPFLDLFTLDEHGQWDYPPWTKDFIDGHGYRGWFPHSSAYRYDIDRGATVVYTKEV